MILARGELANRIEKNRIRLQDSTYKSPDVFNKGGDWDGDWQGRTILALSSHYNVAQTQAAKKEVMVQLNDIIDALDAHTNEDGYFGLLFDGKTCNEQQLSGNSWFLRGLSEYYKITKDERILMRLNNIAERYLSKLVPFYKKYPLVDREDGGVGGHLLRVTVDDWFLSSDIACAYILLDGITALYEVTSNPCIKDTMETMIDNFISIDYVAKNCQTHAILSGTRGLLRYCATTGRTDLIPYIERNFDIYLNCGMTNNFANYNWFGRPFWTEPCAVVDSILVAQQLYELTKKREYLEFCSRCYANAIRSCQRINGGAGCETCLNDDNDTLSLFLYEAEFCCSMRLAEGLKHINDFNIIIDDDTYLITSLNSNFDYSDKTVQISQDFNFGEKSCLKLSVKSENDIKLKIYLPQNATVKSLIKFSIENNFIIFSNCGNNLYEFIIEFAHYKMPRGKKQLNMLADCILTQKTFDYNAPFVLNIEDRVLSPMLNFMEVEATIKAEKIVQKI